MLKRKTKKLVLSPREHYVLWDMIDARLAGAVVPASKDVLQSIQDKLRRLS